MAQQTTGEEHTQDRPKTNPGSSSVPRSEFRVPSSIGAILFGVVLIVVLIPLVQFLTIQTVNSDLETGAPVGWAAGLVFSLILVVLVVRLIAKVRIVSKPTLVIIYCMLTIAIPMMNMGLVRTFLVAVRSCQRAYINEANNTYRTAYQSQKATWFPIVPTTEGLAWNKAERLLRVLQAPAAVKQREKAKRNVALAVSVEAEKLGKQGNSYRPPPADGVEAIRKNIARLGPDETAAVLKQAEVAVGQTNLFQEALQALGLVETLEARHAEALEASRSAAQRLIGLVGEVDDQEACYTPQALAEKSRKAQIRFERDRDRLTPSQKEQLQQRIEKLSLQFDSLRADVSQLSLEDYARVRTVRKDRYLEAFASVDERDLAGIRTAFVYRSSPQERRDMIKQDGRYGTPNQNLYALAQSGVFADVDIKNQIDSTQPPFEQFRQKLDLVVEYVPWRMWVGPLVRWSLLFFAIFLFFMCLAEWLRRKWVDRENLAFPLVEVADAMIRHDYDLEEAEDIVHPQRRKGAFSPLFWAGFALAGLLLSLEAAGNYNMASSTKVASYPLSDKVFTAGLMKEFSQVYFVFSPLVVGILFLVSLDVSFSIWVLFFVYKFVFLIAKRIAQVKTGTEIRDHIYTGWGGGVRFPFDGEQLLGACLCLTAIILFKAWQSARRDRERGHHDRAELLANPYVPPKLNLVGLVVVPVVIAVLVWNLGVTNIPFIVFVGLIATGLAIAAARVRAETGLPSQHVTYEFTKLPLVFGMTGWLGARVYTLFITLAFLPVTLLFRLLPQQLENIELARRNRVRYGTIAVASLVAFVVAVSVGLVSALVMGYYHGSGAFGGGATQCKRSLEAICMYPLWVAHFLGEAGLESFTQPHWIRIWFIVVGIVLFGGLMFLRRRIMKWPLHPVGYLLVLLGVYFDWITPYFKDPRPVGDGTEAVWLWGSAFIAWLIKMLIVKYGGMRTYKRLKPLFIGLVVGSIVCICAWNMVDLGVSLQSRFTPPGEEPSEFTKYFLEKSAYNPRAY